MPRDGSGIYSLPQNSWYPPVNGVNATAPDWSDIATDLQSSITQSVSSDGQTVMSAPLPMGNNKITGLATGTADTDGVTVGQLKPLIGQSGSTAARNRLINGAFQINQRVVSGSVVLAAGAYGHDRWKAGSGGCTYTFATTGGITTITIVSGTLVQVVEGANIEGGTYCMSWGGTSTGKIAGGSFAASGVNATSIPGGADLSLEFSTGTLYFAQLEPGTTPTPFEHRSIGLDMQLCKRYYQVVAVGYQGLLQSGVAYGGSVTLPVDMRAPPTLTFITDNVVENFPAATLNLVAVSVNWVNYWKNANGTGAGRYYSTFSAASEL